MVLFCGLFFLWNVLLFCVCCRVQGALSINHFLLALFFFFNFSSHDLMRHGGMVFTHSGPRSGKDLFNLLFFSYLCFCFPSVELALAMVWVGEELNIRASYFLVSTWKGVYPRGITLSEHLDSIIVMILSQMTQRNAYNVKWSSVVKKKDIKLYIQNDPIFFNVHKIL